MSYQIFERGKRVGKSGYLNKRWQKEHFLFSKNETHESWKSLLFEEFLFFYDDRHI